MKPELVKRTIKVMKDIIETTDFQNKDKVSKFDVVYHDDLGFGVVVYFNTNNLSPRERDKVLESCWEVIYNYTGHVTFLRWVAPENVREQIKRVLRNYSI